MPNLIQKESARRWSVDVERREGGGGGWTWKGDRWGWKEVTDGRDRGGKKAERRKNARRGENVLGQAEEGKRKEEEEEVTVQEDADKRGDN